MFPTYHSQKSYFRLGLFLGVQNHIVPGDSNCNDRDFGGIIFLRHGRYQSPPMTQVCQGHFSFVSFSLIDLIYDCEFPSHPTDKIISNGLQALENERIRWYLSLVFFPCSPWLKQPLPLCLWLLRCDYTVQKSSVWITGLGDNHSASLGNYF